MNVGTPLTHAIQRDTEGLRLARQFIIESLRTWTVDERAANAALDVANELISNAVQHGAPPVGVQLDLDDNGTVTVVVRDGSLTPARPLPYRAGVSERGLGLRIVAQLSTEWGQRTEVDGKSVWATIRSARSRPVGWDR